MIAAARYGFGPAAAISIVAKHLRPHLEHLSYAGVGHTLDLQRHVGYDEILDLNPSSPKFKELLSRFDVVISNTEWAALQVAVDQGLIAIGLDQLLWCVQRCMDWTEMQRMAHQCNAYRYVVLLLVFVSCSCRYWDNSEYCSLPPCVPLVDKYLVVAFFGVRDKLDTWYQNVKPVAEVVSRPGHKVALAVPVHVNPAATADSPHKGSVHVSFGGLFNPTIEDAAFLPFAMAVGRSVANEPHYLLGNAKLKALTGLQIEFVPHRRVNMLLPL